MEYCTYLTIYKGNKLPMFYIGYSTVNKVVNENYHGSVSSKKYKKIWNSELRKNPHLFITKILRTHESKEEALAKEKKILLHLNAHKSEMYINMTISHEKFGMQKDINKNKVACRNIKTNETLSVTKEEFESNPDLVGVNAGYVFVKDEHGNRLKVTREEFESNDKLTALSKDRKFKLSTPGHVACIDKDGNKLSVSKEEYAARDDLVHILAGRKNEKLSLILKGRKNPKLSERRKGMIMARNILTNEVGDVSIEEFHSNPNLVGVNKGNKETAAKISAKAKGKIICKNKHTGEFFKVTREEFDNNPDLIHSSRGMVTCKNKYTGIMCVVTKEEFDNNPELIGTTGKLVQKET